MGLETLEDGEKGVGTIARDLASTLLSVPRKHPVGWAIAWTILLLVLTLAPKNTLPRVERLAYHPDLIVHFVLFAGFVVSWLRVGRSWRWWVTIAPIALILAASTEYAQGLPWIDRDPDLLDGVADSTGVIVGYVVTTILYRRRKTRLSDTSLDSVDGNPAMASK
jgi:hypothetical protein